MLWTVSLRIPSAGVFVMLDYFALIILIVLLLTILAVIAGLGMAPGRIARKRNHPQADAVNVCGWFGVLSMGILLPVAFIWAFWDSQASSQQHREDVK